MVPPPELQLQLYYSCVISKFRFRVFFFIFTLFVAWTEDTCFYKCSDFLTYIWILYTMDSYPNSNCYILGQSFYQLGNVGYRRGPWRALVSSQVPYWPCLMSSTASATLATLAYQYMIRDEDNHICTRKMKKILPGLI